MTTREFVEQYNTVAELEAGRKEIEEAIDSKMKSLVIKEEAKELEDKSFGFIKESFENLSERLWKTKKGRAIIGSYIRTIRESKDLRALHGMYENLRRLSPKADMDFALNSVVKSTGKLSEKVGEDIRSLGKILAEAYEIVGEDAKSLLAEENTKLDGAVAYIMENEMTSRNIPEYGEAVSIIKEKISSNKAESIFEGKKDSMDIDKLLEEFNSKYSGVFSEKERELFNTIIKEEKIEEGFRMCKERCMQTLITEKRKSETKGDTEAVGKLDEIMSKVDGKTFAEETALNDIVNFMNLSSVFE